MKLINLYLLTIFTTINSFVINTPCIKSTFNNQPIHNLKMDNSITIIDNLIPISQIPLSLGINSGLAIFGELNNQTSLTKLGLFNGWIARFWSR